MHQRMNPTFFALLLVTLAFLETNTGATIYRWDNHQPIAGTENITPGPGVDLAVFNLAFADLGGADLTNSRFFDTGFTPDLTQANFTGAIVAGAMFTSCTATGFTAQQLYSTASYQQKDLHGIWLDANDLTGWDFTNQNLTGAQLDASNLTNAVFTGATVAGASLGNSLSLQQLVSTASYQAHDLNSVYLSINFNGVSLAGFNLRNAQLGGDLTQVNLANSDLTRAWFSGANLSGVSFANAVIDRTFFTSCTGLTAQQIYSTTAYANHSLQWIGFPGTDLSGWSFVNQNLTGAYLAGATLTGTDFTGATIANARFDQAIGLTAQQLYATASYAAKDLHGISLGQMDLSGANFSNQNLNSAQFMNPGTKLVGVSFAGADLTKSRFYSANVTNADFSGATITAIYMESVSGFTAQQFYSTLNYQTGNLQQILLYSDNLTGWNFAAKRLDGSSFYRSNLTNASFSGATLKQASFENVTSSQGTDFTNADASSGASFYGANLTGASFSGANLAGAYFVLAKFTNCNFSGADLRGARSFTPGTGALLTNTIMPDGTVTGLHITPGTSLTIRNNVLGVVAQQSAAIDPNGVLEFVVDNNAWGSTVSFGSGVTPGLEGILALNISSDADPGFLLGRSFRLFDWGPGLPAEDQFTGFSSNVPAGFSWDVSNLYSSGTVMLVPEPAPISLLGIGVSWILLRRRK